PVRSRAREGRAFLPCSQQGLLYEVFGVVERAQHPIAMHEQFTPVRSHQGLESHLIVRLGGEHQCSLGWSLHRGTSSSRLFPSHLCFHKDPPTRASSELTVMPIPLGLNQDSNASGSIQA